MPELQSITAYWVMAAATVWIVSGEFAAIGGAEGTEADAEAAPSATPTEAVPLVRTVSAVAPAFIDHARAIRISGVTEADKRAELAARSEGVVARLNLAKGGLVTEGQEVLALEGPEEEAQAEIAEINASWRSITGHIYKGRNSLKYGPRDTWTR